MKTPSPFSGFSQMAYVTTDMDQAMAIFAEHYAVPEFMQLRDLPIQTGTGRQAQLNVALAHVDNLQIELIQPLGGDDGVYRDTLPDSGFGLRFHHVAQILPTQEALTTQRAELLRRGCDIVLEGESPGMIKYFYSDHRATLGHFIEHCFYTEDAMLHFQQIPRFQA